MGPGNQGADYWFALSVKQQHEKAVACALRRKNLEEYLPLYRERRAWSDRVKTIECPLFPGYVFCRFAYADRLAVLNTPGLISILGAGQFFSPIAADEIAAIRRVVESGVSVLPHPYVSEGDSVYIERGPLAGVGGIVLRRKGSTRLIISLEILSRSIAVELDCESVAVACGRAAHDSRTQVTYSFAG